MISNESIKLLNAWKNHLFAELSISEIMALAKKQTKPWVFNSLGLLAKSSILSMKRKGNLNLYSLNLNNPPTVQLLQYLEIQGILTFPKIDIIRELIENIPIKNYCLVVFGSYAENRQKTSSDLDICFLIDSKKTEKKIKPYANEIKLNFPTELDDHYITFGDFAEMLVRKEENLGKQIAKKHLIFYNADIYYQLLKEAHKHGFGQ